MEYSRERKLIEDVKNGHEFGIYDFPVDNIIGADLQIDILSAIEIQSSVSQLVLNLGKFRSLIFK